MEKEFVPYDIALTLKKLGFDEKCLGIYYNAEDGVVYSDPTWKLLIGGKANENNEWEVKAILYQQSFRWFREKHGLYHQIGWFGGDKYLCGITPSSYTAEFETYEEAELACLRKLIEIVDERY
jgi:hypothetical protein